MQIDKTNSLEHSNFKMFLATVQTLASSQGFYSRLQRTINDWTPEELEEHEKTEEFLKDFETTWNGLNEKNKQHIRNGLGDNLIQTEEQAQIVNSVAKFMLLFQELDKQQ